MTHLENDIILEAVLTCPKCMKMECVDVQKKSMVENTLHVPCQQWLMYFIMLTKIHITAIDQSELKP